MKIVGVITMEYWMTQPPTQISINEYNQAFPTSNCFYLMQGEKQVLVVKGKKSGKVFIAPENESEFSFHDRLARSEHAGRNLFFKEWKELKG